LYITLVPSLSLLPYSAARAVRPSWTARQIFSGVAGISIRTPVAMVSALMTAAGAPIAPASPQPYTPSELEVQAVPPLVTTSKFGKSCARGIV
jgi:hypothetical protein